MATCDDPTPHAEHTCWEMPPPSFWCDGRTAPASTVVSGGSTGGTVRVRQRELYDVWCDRCNNAIGSTVKIEQAAFVMADNHATLHAHWDIIGPTLVGRVYVPLPGVRLDTACRTAIDCDYPYIAWNGIIITSVSPDLLTPICRVEDVPGLERA